MNPQGGETYLFRSSQQLPSLGLLKADVVLFMGPQPQHIHTLLLELLRYMDTIIALCKEVKKPHQEQLHNANLDYVLVKKDLG